MTWVAPRHDRDGPWYVRLLLALLARRGRVSLPVRLWSRSPRVLVAFLHFLKAVERKSSPLDPPLRALVMARVSQLNGCEFCADLNAARALERGVGAHQLAALERHGDAEEFDERQRIALAYAEAVAAPGATVPPDLRARVRSAFSDDEIVELTALVAFQTLSCKFNSAMGVPPEGRCELPLPGSRQRAGGR